MRFEKCVTDGRTDGPTDKLTNPRTKPLIEFPFATKNDKKKQVMANSCKMSRILLNFVEFSGIRSFEEEKKRITNGPTDPLTDKASYRIAFGN